VSKKCDREASKNEAARPPRGCRAIGRKNNLVAKKVFLKRSVRLDCRINKNKYTLVIIFHLKNRKDILIHLEELHYILNPITLLSCNSWFKFVSVPRSALFWDMTQRYVVVLYRRFGTTYRSYGQGSRSRLAYKNYILNPITLLSCKSRFKSVSVPLSLLTLLRPSITHGPLKTRASRHQ
jgi:hypothetical protein